MGRPIGYYVHHQGDGHRQRALAIARSAPCRITLLGTGLAGRTGDVPMLDLPDDAMPGHGFDGQDGGKQTQTLHYTPTDHDGVRERVASLSRWIAEERPALLVVDVSVEIAMLARLASVPVVYVRLNGDRSDEAHLEAFRSARAVLAPFHCDLDDAATPAWLRRRTFYAPGLGKRPGVAAIDDRLILVVLGTGGGGSDGNVWAAAARSTPDQQWRVVGPCTAADDPPPNLELRGWIDDVATMIASAAVVVGAAGDGVVGAVIAARRPLICIPESRPYGEQVSKAARLCALNAAIVVSAWPSMSDWPELITRARSIELDRLARLDGPDGPVRVAQWLQALATTRSLTETGVA